MTITNRLNDAKNVISVAEKKAGLADEHLGS